MKKKLKFLFLISSIFFILISCSKDSTQHEINTWFPKDTVKLIVPSTAGGGHDTAARVFAMQCEKITGVKINIVNNGAGGGAIAFSETMNAKPDGLTIGQLGSGLASDQYTVQGAQYTPNSYEYIGIYSGDDIHLVVNPNGKLGSLNLEGFLDYAKNNTTTIACSGTWGQSDSSRYLIEETTRIKFKRVGIKGGANCALAVISEDVDAALVFPSEIISQVKAGNLKVLAKLGEHRNSFFPETPTFIEKGYNIDFPSFRVLALPKGTPEEIVNGWRDIFNRTMENPETIKELEKVGITPKFITGNESLNYIMKTHDVVKKIIDSGIMEQKLY